MWLRSVNVWSTLFLSAFHLQTLRRVAPTAGTLHRTRGTPTTLLLSLGLIWCLNFIYSIPAYVFSTNGNRNSTEVRNHHHVQLTYTVWLMISVAVSSHIAQRAKLQFKTFGSVKRSILKNRNHLPALVFSQTMILVSSTTRPLMGCLWNFPSSYSGLAYATTSMVIHETIPIILMIMTNLTSLYTLYTHGRVRSSDPDAPILTRVPAERRAAKVRDDS